MDAGIGSVAFERGLDIGLDTSQENISVPFGAVIHLFILLASCAALVFECVLFYYLVSNLCLLWVANESQKELPCDTCWPPLEFFGDACAV